MRKGPLAILALTVFLAVCGNRGAQAAELVMFEEPGCTWCQRWDAEVAPAYPLSAQGRMAPLRRVHIGDQATAGVSLERPVTGTPTFVLADEGREVGRIVGYPGPAYFYGQLDRLLERLPKDGDRFRLPQDREVRRHEQPHQRLPTRARMLMSTSSGPETCRLA
jgi:hypothetical protein